MLGKRESLSSLVIKQIAKKIDDGTYDAGDRIPTESELCAEYGVSRTVVREAIASLRADGMLISRQGIGVFVSNQPKLPPFEISPEAVGKVADILLILELRLSVEVEATGLAAERHTERQLKHIKERLDAIEAEFRDPKGDGGHADFGFHTAIAKATNNPYFEKFVSFIGPIIIPRLHFNALTKTRDQDQAYHDRIQGEHHQILEAIAARNVDGARQAMRMHLMGALERYRRLGEKK